jgi:DNA-binding MarR family transcriptional regulator
MTKTIQVKKVRSPAPGNIEDDIDFICKSFGYFTLRDKQDSAGRIFRLLVKEACGDKDGVTSDSIAESLELSRGAIIHHLNSFIKSGLIVKENNLYRLRSHSLQKCIEEIKFDIDRIFTQMIKIAVDIDNKLGHYYR